MINITEETEASVSDDEFIVNPVDSDTNWDTFETSELRSLILYKILISCLQFNSLLFLPLLYVFFFYFTLSIYY